MTTRRVADLEKEVAELRAKLAEPPLEQEVLALNRRFFSIESAVRTLIAQVGVLERKESARAVEHGWSCPCIRCTADRG